MFSLRRSPSEPSVAVVAGAMCGLAYTFVPGVPLELLMWGWMVPLLLHLRGVAGFWRFTRTGALAMFVALSVACWWIALPSLRVGVVGIGLGVVFMTVPWAALWALRALAGWRAALWSFPLVWMAWEGAMLASPFGPAGNTLATSQGRLTWMVQMADLGGAWLVTGWVVLANVALTRTVERWQAREAAAAVEPDAPPESEPGARETGTVRAAPASAVARRRAVTASPARRRVAGRLARTLALLVVPPLGYAAVRLFTLAPDVATIRVTSVQPNLVPSLVATRGDFEAASLATLALAEGALADPSARPDLVVLPEAAFSADLRRDAAARLDLSMLVARGGIPVLTGMVARPWVPPAERSAMLRADGRAHLQQNAAVLVTPEAARRRWTPADTLVRAGEDPAVYAKRRLIPLVEGMPYADRFPAFARLGLALSPHGLYDARTGEAHPLAFSDRRGRTWRAGVLICYEQFYPDDAASAVRQGAHLLVSPTNESWFARTSGSRLISVGARLRAIETRRALVRATTTGLTGFVDARGRPYGEVPTWTATTASQSVALRTDRTVYVRFGHRLPVISAWALLLVGLYGIAGRLARRGKRRPSRSRVY